MTCHMRFVDEAEIHVAAGHGGPGCVAFRREKYVPRGGPSGGDGGRGGNIIFRATDRLSTLNDLRYRRIYKAGNGQPGQSSHKSGPAGSDVEVRVPVGTVVKIKETGESIDLSKNDETWVACQGGRGGKGNSHFATARFQAPKFAQEGEPGESADLKLELKLLADVGIIGQPNAGKSTLISRISAAKPRIADYAFTTLVPQLGVVSLGLEKSIVVADIPGLIKGSHRGSGLGHQFLRHIERTRVLLHLLDGSLLLEKIPPNYSNIGQKYRRGLDKVVESYAMIRHELGLYNESLIKKPEVIILNKIDVIPLEEQEAIQSELRSKIGEALKRTQSLPLQHEEPLILSAVTGLGVEKLIQTLQAVFSPKKETSLPGLRTEERTDEAPKSDEVLSESQE